MPVNAFIGKTAAPEDAELSAELGPTRALWDQLTSELAQEQNVVTQEWYSYSPKAGWSLRLKRAKRTILYLIPARGGMTAAFVLGGKAIEAARQARLPRKILGCIEAGQKYPEGTGVRIDIKSATDLAGVKKLAAIKIAN
jgi:hypothetical protein